ncbi:hypothetical protein NKG94_11170 [Micromonospora sp. M12]
MTISSITSADLESGIVGFGVSGQDFLVTPGGRTFGLNATPMGTYFSPSGSEPRKESCVAVLTTNRLGNLDIDADSLGKWWCMRTNEGHTGAITVQSVSVERRASWCSGTCSGGDPAGRSHRSSIHAGEHPCRPCLVLPGAGSLDGVSTLLTQLPALLGVLVGTLGTILATSLADRARWRRGQSVRWDERRLDAYVDYAHALKESHAVALRLTADLRPGSYSHPIDRDEGLARLAEADARRTIVWENLLLLGDEATVVAAASWRDAIWQVERLARGSSRHRRTSRRR